MAEWTDRALAWSSPMLSLIHIFDEIAGFNAVSSEAGKILDDDAVDLIGPYQLNELLYLRTLKIRAAISVVDELRDLRVQGFGHGGRVFVENKALILNAQTVVLVAVSYTHLTT